MNIFSSEHLLELIQGYQNYLGLIVLVVAFFESFVLIGFFIPGSLVLFSVGTLIAPANLDMFVIILCNYLGAVMGYQSSFLIGRFFRQPLKHSFLYKQHRELFGQGEKIFQKYDGISVALGRFFGPLRATVPTVAGMLGMQSRLFFIINLLSALIWAPLYILSGFFLGQIMTDLGWVNYLPGLSLLVLLYFILRKYKN